jgi:hypothetical protein
MTALPSKEGALDAFETKVPRWLEAARAAAVILAEDGPVTVDDIRIFCPPPEGIDPRVMGAIFRGPDWVACGFVNSARAECHKRPVRQFRYAGQAAGAQQKEAA